MSNINYQPLFDIKDDKLGFDESSTSISNFIESFPNNQPYSIALFGSWGSGKSTMLNFIEQKLDAKKNIIIRFNPWLILNEENLVSTIFEEIAFAIKDKKYVKLKKTILNYGRKVCVSGSKFISKGLLKQHGVDDDTADSISDISSNIVDSLFNTDSPIPLSIKKIALEQELITWSTKENKKIVIFIDEIDRLFPIEIVEIFKLIKATISFPSVLFVVAMDKQSVIDSLESIQIKRADEYLIKIFQQRIHINTKFQLQTLFRELLYPLLETIPQLSREPLIYATDVVIFLNRSNFYAPVELPDHSIWEIHNKYIEVNRHLSEYLSIPRNFTNYMSFILSKWNYYYDELSKDGKLNDRDLISSFIIITLFYINPDLVENRTLGNRENNDNIVFPLIFTVIRYEFFNSIYPEIRENVEGTPNRVKVYYDDKIIRKAIYVLKKYPDLRSFYEK